MNKLLLSVMLVGFAVAAQAGDDKACAGKDSACCGKEKTSTEAKAQCPMMANKQATATCPYMAKQASKDATAKDASAKPALASPKALADARK